MATIVLYLPIHVSLDIVLLAQLQPKDIATFGVIAISALLAIALAWGLTGVLEQVRLTEATDPSVAVDPQRSR